MEKRISTRELAAVKRTAMNVAPVVAKKIKAKAMIDKWTKEYNTQEAALAGYESGLMAQLGLRTEQVVTKVVENTGKFDKNGKEIKQTKYVLNDNVRYDSENNEYVVTIADENDNESAPCDCGACDCTETESEPCESEHSVEELIADAVDAVAEPVAVEEGTFEEMFGH